MKKFFQNTVGPAFVSFALLGLLIITAVSFALAHFEQSKKLRESQISFQKVTLIFQDEIESFVFGLQGMAGVFVTANFHPTRLQVENYARSRQYFENFSGALGFGFIRYVKPENLPGFLKSKLKDFPDFQLRTLRPKEPKEDSFIIEFIEPLNTNKPALGLDVSTEKNRYNSALTAAKSGKPIVTSSIQLVQVDRKEPGFLFYLPVYASIAPPETEKERLENLVGWAYTPIVFSKIFERVASRMDQNLFLRFYQLDDEMKKELTFSYGDLFAEDDTSKFSSELIIGGRNWIIEGVPSHKPSLWPNFFLYLFLGVSAHFSVLFFIYGLMHSRETLEKRSRTAEGWREAVLNGADYSIISTDKNGEITVFNKSAQRMLGYSPEEMIGKNSPAIIHDPKEVISRTDALKKELNIEMEPGFRTFVEKAERQGSDTNEWTYIRKDGSRFPVRLCVTTLRNETGEVFGYLGIAEDLTKTKELEKTVEIQRAKMMSSAKMSSIGEMSAGISHEINNPLAIILGKTNLLIRKVQSGNIETEKCLEDLRKIEETANRIGKIIKGLRSLSRESAQDPLEKIYLESQIEEVLGLCQERFRKNNIEFRSDFQKGIFVKVRPAQLSQVILNLLNNSFDAVEGTSGAWVSISSKETDQGVEIEVKDSGKGITSQISEKIMEPFFTTKDPGKGTGLGLSISNSIIQSFHGRLWLDKNCENTRFVIELPKTA